MKASVVRSPRHASIGRAAVAHIFALSGVAVAQPLFDLLSRQAEFLVAHDVRPLDLILIALLLSVVLPASLVVLTRLAAWLHRSAGQWVHLAQVAGLSGLLALLMLKRLAPGAPGQWLMTAATTLAVAVAASYRRWRAVRTFLTFVSPVALLFPVLFLFTSPVRQMLLPQGVAWTGGRGGATDVPVVMVVLDELPLSSLLDESDVIDRLRYPNLAALGGDAYWFRDATTVADSTTLSVPIILSGQIPERKKLPLAEHYPNNLFTWLDGAGYRLKVFETNTRICPPELCSRDVTRRGFAERFDAVTTDLVVVYLHLLLPDQLAARLPTIDATWNNFTDRTIGTWLSRLLGAAPGTTVAGARGDNAWFFASFLDSITREARPTLHFIHLMLPHVPWRYLPSGKEYGPVGAPTLPHGVTEETWGADTWEIAQGFQRHLLQLGYVDGLIGELVAKLEQQDLYDSALIILVADHGASFRPEIPRRVPTAKNFADVLNVPLLVKLPEQTQGVLSERNVETIDILPTVADVLHLSLPWPTAGQSMINSSLPERPAKFTVGAVGKDGLARNPWDIEALRAGRRQAVASKLRVFGSGAKPNGLIRIGNRADLVGRRTSELRIASVAAVAEPAISIELDQAWAYDEVDLTSPFMPAHITGRARFAQPRDAQVELAIAVNGTVEAVTRTFAHDGDGARFTAMVREEALVAGRNQVEVFEIRDRGGVAVLVPTGQQSEAGFALVQTDGEEAIRSADGRHIPLVKGHVRGHFKVRRSSMGSQLSGFAVGAEQQAAETLLVFVGRRLATVTRGGLEPDNRRTRAMKPWRRQASFRIWVPDALIADSWSIRLFAILGDVASEIRLKVPATASPPRKVRSAGQDADH